MSADTSSFWSNLNPRLITEMRWDAVEIDQRMLFRSALFPNGSYLIFGQGDNSVIRIGVLSL